MPGPLSVRKTEAALGMLEDQLAIELALAHDLAATTPTSHTLGVPPPPSASSRKQPPRQNLPEVVGHAVGEFHLSHRAVRASLAARAVVRDHNDQGVVALLGLLQVVQ
jgi:hypothetical protein